MNDTDRLQGLQDKAACLVINAGSSSIKCGFYDLETLTRLDRFTCDLSGDLSENPAGDVYERAFDDILARLYDGFPDYAVSAIGHRVLHGGEIFSAPALVTPEIFKQLEGLIPLGPLHQPHNLRGITTLSRLLPGVPHAACFDTAFHTSMGPVNRIYPISRALIDKGYRRYGFHGISYEYIAHALGEHLPHLADKKVIVAHLGNGASMCAMDRLKCVITSMGMTALDGLMMGTRSGAIDPGMMLDMMRNEGYSVEDISSTLYHKSGLLGVSGRSSDMRELLEHAQTDPNCEEAVALFALTVARTAMAQSADLAGFDALVFTGGIGENAAPVRARIAAHLEWMGLSLDPGRNAEGPPEGAKTHRISQENSPLECYVIPTNEERMIARHTKRLVEERAHAGP